MSGFCRGAKGDDDVLVEKGVQDVFREGLGSEVVVARCGCEVEEGGEDGVVDVVRAWMEDVGVEEAGLEEVCVKGSGGVFGADVVVAVREFAVHGVHYQVED